MLFECHMHGGHGSLVLGEHNGSRPFSAMTTVPNAKNLRVVAVFRNLTH